MARHRRSERWAQIATAVGVAVVVVAALAVGARAKTHIRQTLHATAHAPRASGVAQLMMKTGSKGNFTIKVRGLPGGKVFDVVVNNVKVGTLVTGVRGRGTAKFSTSPKGRVADLGFDPQGADIAVRDDETGDDDLMGDMTDDHPDSAIGCCLGNKDDDGEVECEDLTAAECSAEGGTATTATSCLPNPCGSQPPPTPVVCCLAHSASGAFLDDDPEVECEDDVSQAECATQGGMVVQATSCDPNPCQPAPPPNLVICCVSQGDQGDQEGDQGEDVPRTEPPQCARLTASDCSDEGGTVSSAASCMPNPCVASPCGAFLD